MPKTIALCSSVSFYRQMVGVKHELQQLGWSVLMPKLAELMEESGDFEFLSYQEQFDATAPQRKGELMRAGFANVASAECTLVLNYEKHGQVGYIGPNVLMEMAVAYHLGKPLYCLFDLPEQSPFSDELHGMQPTIIRQFSSLDTFQD